METYVQKISFVFLVLNETAFVPKTWCHIASDYCFEIVNRYTKSNPSEMYIFVPFHLYPLLVSKQFQHLIVFSIFLSVYP